MNTSMNIAAVYHRCGMEYRYAYNGRVYIRLRTAANDMDKVEFSYGARFDFNNSQKYVAAPMNKILTDGIHDWFEYSFIPEDPRIRYFFTLYKADERLFYFERNFSETRPDFILEEFSFPYAQRSDEHAVPEWARGAVVYQIFPDRFCRAAGSPPLTEAELTPMHRLGSWGEPLDENGNLYFFGGNLRGITEKLSWLQQLNVDIIYLTPIFKSSSTHRYDVADYYQIDPLLGNKNDLRDLVRETHKRGMRIVLDAVFNHTSVDFFAFADLLKNGEKSEYRDWYFPVSFPVEIKKRNYATFAHTEWMPKLNMSNPAAQDYFCQVGAYWLREFEIDGWRMDVLNEINLNFLRRFREAARAVRADALIIGEVWNDSFVWLQGDMLDGVMHYPFMYPAEEFFARGLIDVEEFDRRVNRVEAMYTHQVNDINWTLLDSHDCRRFLTACGGDEARLRAAVFFQMTYTGSPFIFYGDELGVAGGHDPLCRATMPWELADALSDKNSLASWYASLTRLRRRLPALRTGRFKTLCACARTGIYAFTRTLENGECALIAQHTGAAKRPENTLSNEPCEVKLSLPRGMIVLREEFSNLPFLVENSELSIRLSPGEGAVFSCKMNANEN